MILVVKMRLSENLVVITGATGLLGKQHAYAVLEESGRVVLLDINQSALDEFASELSNQYPGSFLALKCDISNEQEILDALSAVQKAFGTPNGLVNNAAINPSVEKNSRRFSRIEDITKSEWDLEFQVGLWGSFLCSRIFGAAMIEAGISGSIVNISSDHGLIAPNQNLYKVDGLKDSEQPVKPVTYSVIKHGLIGLTRYLATYWADSDIRVNTLCPGGVLNGQNEQFLNRFNSIVPMGRPARPSEYQGALKFMLSEESSYMTGSTVVIDGGRSVW
jgi:NAD(P)-dependent dehydrogenase (short-subunit alcohol dehydrogenase family)